MTTEPNADRWYTITVVEHVVHPRHRTDDSPPPEEVVACTVLPNLAGSILRATADQIDPKKPVMRGRSLAEQVEDIGRGAGGR